MVSDEEKSVSVGSSSRSADRSRWLQMLPTRDDLDIPLSSGSVSQLQNGVLEEQNRDDDDQHTKENSNFHEDPLAPPKDEYERISRRTSFAWKGEVNANRDIYVNLHESIEQKRTKKCRNCRSLVWLFAVASILLGALLGLQMKDRPVAETVSLADSHVQSVDIQSSHYCGWGTRVEDCFPSVVTLACMGRGTVLEVFQSRNTVCDHISRSKAICVYDGNIGNSSESLLSVKSPHAAEVLFICSHSAGDELARGAEADLLDSRANCPNEVEGFISLATFVEKSNTSVVTKGVDRGDAIDNPGPQRGFFSRSHEERVNEMLQYKATPLKADEAEHQYPSGNDFYEQGDDLKRGEAGNPFRVTNGHFGSRRLSESSGLHLVSSSDCRRGRVQKSENGGNSLTYCYGHAANCNYDCSFPGLSISTPVELSANLGTYYIGQGPSAETMWAIVDASSDGS